MALDTIQGNHPTLGILLACVFTIIKPCTIWICYLLCLPSMASLFFSRLPEKDFPKLIVSPRNFVTYCFVEQEVRLESLFWVLVLHFQTSMYLQRLSNELSPSICKHTCSASKDSPRPLKQSQFENLLSMLRDTPWHFFSLPFITELHFIWRRKKRVLRRTLGSHNQERNDSG